MSHFDKKWVAIISLNMIFAGGIVLVKNNNTNPESILTASTLS